MKYIGTKLTAVTLGLSATFMAWVAWAAEATEEIASLLAPLVQHMVSGEWILAGAVFVMIGTVGIRQYALPKWDISESTLPYVTMLLSAVSVGAGKLLGADEVNLMVFAGASLSFIATSMLSNGLWDQLGEQLFKKLFKAFGIDFKRPKKDDE